MNKIHFIGIGGIGISTLAQIYNEQGKTITGSDIEDSELIAHLKEDGIKVALNHAEENLDDDTDLVIYSFAIEEKNVERQKAKHLNIKQISYPEALGEFTKDFYVIGITGTHGKSTTTSMVAVMAEKAGIDPNVIVGTKIREFGNKNYRLGKSSVLIIEACEFRNAFLNYKLDVLAIINIDNDHLDFFKTHENYVKAFNEACKRVPENGYIIIDADDYFSENINAGSKAKLIKITSDKAKFDADNNKTDAKTYFLEDHTLNSPKNASLEIHPDIPGKFNIRNASFAAVIGNEILKIPTSKLEEGIKAFKGSWRRMELKQTNLENILFYDDYGHLPAEIDNTLKAIRETHPTKRIIAVFQPHQFIRIRNLLKEFGECFEAADLVLIPDILRNRDTLEQMASIKTDELLNEIKKHKPANKVFHTTDIEDTATWLKTHQSDFDVIVATGSGNIKKLYKML